VGLRKAKLSLRSFYFLSATLLFFGTFKVLERKIFIWGKTLHGKREQTTGKVGKMQGWRMNASHK